jgi:hypothetical protein
MLLVMAIATNTFAVEVETAYCGASTSWQSDVDSLVNSETYQNPNVFCNARATLAKLSIFSFGGELYGASNLRDITADENVSYGGGPFARFTVGPISLEPNAQIRHTDIRGDEYRAMVLFGYQLGNKRKIE